MIHHARVALALLGASSFLVAADARAHDGDPFCGVIPEAVARLAPPAPNKPRPFLGLSGGRPPVRPVLPGPPPPNTLGALTGKTVYLSAGHGFTWLNGGWTTQRGTTQGIVEDLVSAEAVAQYLIPYLRNMGAYVVPLRDPDFQTALVVVDDDAATIDGALEELSSSDAGWGKLALPLAGHENPFEAGGTRLFSSAAAATGKLVYAPTIAETGYYNVYVSYVQGADRVSDAHYEVRHAGGTSTYRVDQRRHGTTWVMLGRHWFEAGAPASRASVVLQNDSEDAASGAVISTDAVRFGAGRGQIDRGGGPIDRPMWESSCRYNAQLSGAPPSVYDSLPDDMRDDIYARSRFAAWDHEEGEDAIYVAWHTNAPNPGRGTESFAYGIGDPPQPRSQFAGVEGSLELLDAVHDRLIDDIHARWDPTWRDRGKFTADFGELNPNNNPEMPAVLIEVGYHDTPADADALREPYFRRIAAQAISRGIAGYFATRDGEALTIAPEPPTAVRVTNDGQGGLRVSWRPPTEGDAPVEGYRVYVSDNGYGFDDGTDVTGESMVLQGLSAGAVRYVRVATSNRAGVSLPSEVVGARLAVAGSAQVLVVGGFDRLDAGLMPVEDLSPYGLALTQRMRLDRMNDGSYMARHGAAIAAAGYAFDGASDEAVALGDVDPSAYVALDWFLGETSDSELLDAVQREAIGAHLGGGGRLLISGAEIAWALDEKGDDVTRAFQREILHAAYATDDAATYDVDPTTGIYQGMPPLAFDDATVGSYDAEWPDTFTPGEGATAALEYAGGEGGIAAVDWRGQGGAAVVIFGFPFETITGADVRAEVMRRTLESFGVTVEPPSVEEPTTSSTTSNGAGGGGAGGEGGGGGAGATSPGFERVCACRVSGGGSSEAPVIVAIGAALAVLRRRARRGAACGDPKDPSSDLADPIARRHAANRSLDATASLLRKGSADPRTSTFPRRHS